MCIITPSDAFGFYTGGVISAATCIPCFKTALGLYASLPVSLENFEIKCIDNQSIIKWKIANGAKDITFEVEKSEDGAQWITIATQMGDEGITAYEWRDNSQITQLYRLKTTSLDGEIAYSTIRSAYCGKSNLINIYPNPTHQEAIVQVEGTNACLLTISLFDIAGRLIWENQLDIDQNIKNTIVPAWQYPAGTYILKVKLSTGATETRKIVFE